MSCVRAGLAAIAVSAGIGMANVSWADSLVLEEPALYDAGGRLIGVVEGGAEAQTVRVQVLVDVGGDAVLLPADRSGFNDDGGDAVFFQSDDCSGDGYVWDPEDAAGESNGWKRSRALPGQVVGTNKLVFVPDPAASPSIVEYNSRLVIGGCVVQPGSDHLVRAILKGSVRAFEEPFVVRERY